MIARAIVIFLTVLAAFLVLIYLDGQAPAQEPDYIIGTPIEDPPQEDDTP